MKKILFIAFVMLSAINLHAQLPNVRLQDMDGKTVQTGEISNDGKPVIISFWATWCKPCLRELKAIHEVYPDWQDETGVKMYIVSIDQAQDANRVKPLVDGFGSVIAMLHRYLARHHLHNLRGYTRSCLCHPIQKREARFVRS